MNPSLVGRDEIKTNTTQSDKTFRRPASGKTVNTPPRGPLQTSGFRHLLRVMSSLLPLSVCVAPKRYGNVAAEWTVINYCRSRYAIKAFGGNHNSQAAGTHRRGCPRLSMTFYDVARGTLREQLEHASILLAAAERNPVFKPLIITRYST